MGVNVEHGKTQSDTKKTRAGIELQEGVDEYGIPFFRVRCPSCGRTCCRIFGDRIRTTFGEGNGGGVCRERELSVKCTIPRCERVFRLLFEM